MFEPGAIAATWAASVTKSPAEAARPPGRHEDDHGHPGPQDRLDHHARRVDEAARRVQDEQQAGRLLPLRALDRIRDPARRDRGQRLVLEHELEHAGRPIRGVLARYRCIQKDQGRQERKLPHDAACTTFA